MRECFGFGRIVRTESGWGATFAGTAAAPVELMPSLTGNPVPDLTAFDGKVLQLVGSLDASTVRFGGGTSTTVQTAGLRLSDVLLEPENNPVPWAMSHLHCAIAGNIGKSPEINPSKDRLTASMAFLRLADGNSAWINLTAYEYLSVCDQLRSLETGGRITAIGTLETYIYNGRPKLQLALVAIGLLPKSEARPQPISLMASRPALSADAADAFVSAA